MIVLPISEYWQAVARGIDAEEAKARLFLHHNESRGVAREAILRDLLIKHTPEPYRVSTGFIYQFTSELWNSGQCDVLVYDPTVAQPDYAIAGLVVVPRWAAKLVIEVKTTLKDETFQQILGIHSDVSWLPVPTLGFAYDGVSFDTFLQYLSTAIKTADAGVPDCIASHQKNFLFVRSRYRLAQHSDAPKRHRPAKYQFAVNFAGTGKDEGRASASFLTFYLALLRNELNDERLADWFSKLDIPREALVSISDEGKVEYGPIPKAKTNGNAPPVS